MTEVTVSALQFACSDDRGENIATAERMVREALLAHLGPFN